MRKIYLTETQLNNYLRTLCEEEYNIKKKIGPFATQEEAVAELNRLRRENGFSNNDSFIEGNYIVLYIEMDRFDDDYVGNLLTNIDRKYGKVAESRD